MIGRIWTLARYLLNSFLRSITGIVLLLMTFAFWLIFFAPNGGATPEPAYFTSLVGILGATLALFSAMGIASIANRAEHVPFFPRLDSRVEFLTSVLLASLCFSIVVQFLAGLMIMLFPGRPQLTLGSLVDIPPLWLSLNIIAAVTGIHASDFAARGWSRVVIFGLLVLFLFGQGIDARIMAWVARNVRRLSSRLFADGRDGMGQFLDRIARWSTAEGPQFFDNLFGFVFWPFRAISDAVRAGEFGFAEALAPAVLLLYATILFMLAADQFANKDLNPIE